VAAQRAWATLSLVALVHQAAYGPSQDEVERRALLVCPYEACGIRGCGGDSEPFWLFPRDRWKTLVFRV